MAPSEPPYSDSYEDEFADDDAMQATSSPHGGKHVSALPRWQKILLGVAGGFVVVGLGLQGLAFARGDATGAGGEAVIAERQSVDVPDGALVTQTQQGEGPGVVIVTPGDEIAGEAGTGGAAAEEWSPFFFKGGFGFFIGFCIGYALRVFFRVSTVAIGFLLLALAGLAYAGIVDIRWDVMEGYYDQLVDVVRAESGGFQSFVAGTVPASAFSALGLFTGFKRH